MDLSKDQIYVDKDKLDVFSFSIILLKKLSMNKILYESETNSYETSLSFTDMDVYYMNRKNSFIDKRHDISVITHIINKTKQLNGETLDYLNCIFSFQDNNFCCTEPYIEKFKNYLYLNKNSTTTNRCIIDSKFYLKRENTMDYIINDPYFKQKISSIGKSILFYKNYRNSFITFMILFSNYINNTRNTVNLNTMSKLMPLFDKLDNEEIISLPNEDIIIEFINKVLKYKSMLDKINNNPYSANCSTSIFKIKITNKDISLYVNGIGVLNEVHLGRFKYIPHVGLMFFIKCITTMGKFDSLFIKIQKHIIKTT